MLYYTGRERCGLIGGGVFVKISVYNVNSYMHNLCVCISYNIHEHTHFINRILRTHQQESPSDMYARMHVNLNDDRRTLLANVVAMYFRDQNFEKYYN